MSGEMIKRRNQEVLGRLEKFYETSGLSMAAIATKSGYSESYVSRYLNTESAPVGDVEGFEAAVSDMMAAAARRRKWDNVFFDTEAVDRCLLMFDLIDQSNEVGLIYGPAGIGKTVASKRHAMQHETAIYICIREGDGAWYGLVRELWQQIDTRGFTAKVKSSTSKAGYIAKKLNASERLLIVDNAQRLSISGIKWLMDMQDDAGFGLALVGNADILDKVASCDQLSSRIKIRRNVLLDGEDRKQLGWLDDAADKMVRAMWPAATKDILRLARESARQEGHLRRLNSQLRIAIRLSETASYAGRQAAAFVEARHLLVTPTAEA